MTTLTASPAAVSRAKAAGIGPPRSSHPQTTQIEKGTVMTLKRRNRQQIDSAAAGGRITGPRVVGPQIVGPQLVGPRVIAPTALAPLAAAAAAIGALAIGRLAIADAVVRRLRAGEVEIRSLKVGELEIGGQPWTGPVR
jgi:hypothetical protein